MPDFNLIFQNTSELIELAFRFLFNLIVTFVVVNILYYKISRRKDYLFTFTMIGILVFFMCYLMANVNLQIGFALGLFAVFGILRYRTITIPIKEMTFLFVVIGLSVINALASGLDSLIELLFANLAVILMIFVLERLSLYKHESHKTIIYENLLLIQPDKRKQLILDLEDRTGLKINRIDVGRIDFTRGRVKLIIYYYGETSQENLADDLIETENDDDD